MRNLNCIDLEQSMIKAIKILVILTLISCPGFAQNQVRADSLKRELARAKQDGNRVFILMELKDFYQNSIPDSSIYYAHEALSLLRETRYFTQQVPSLIGLAVDFRILGDVGKSMEAAYIGLQLAKDKRDHLRTAMALNSLGTTQMLSLQDYSKAINYFRQAGQIFNELHDERRKAGTIINIGSAYRRDNQSYMNQLT